MANPATFPTRILTRAGELFRGQVVSAIIPGADGYFGVKASHAPLVATLAIGGVSATMPDGLRRHFAVSGGVVEVRDNELVILADIGENAEDIDIPRAEGAAERAWARLRGAGEGKRVDITRAQIAVARALNRLRVARHSH